MSAMRRYLRGVAAALLTLGTLTPYASSQGTTGPKVIIQLQLAGDSEALAHIGSCLASKLSRMPDVQIATGPNDGVRLIVDIVAAKDLFASLVVAETFPVEQYRLRIREARTAMPCWPASAIIRCFDCTSSCQAGPAKPSVQASLPKLATRCYPRNTPSGMTDT